MAGKKYQVFVSSTFEDLKQERQEVIRALLEMNCIPSGMELFPAANESQWSLIQRVIDDCDYFIVIVAGRYGSIGPDGLSYTQMEYEYALKVGKPTMAFLHASPEDLPASRCEKKEDSIRLLADFQALLKKKICSRWSSVPDLGASVVRSLVNLMRDHPSGGWIRGEPLANEYDDRVMPWSIYWTQLRSISERIRRIYSDGRYIPEVIVGISNGGGIYAELLAREAFTGRPSLTMLWAERLRKDGKYFDNDYNKNIIKAIRKSATHADEINVLLVDDIVASGDTHAQVFEFMRAHLPGAKVQFLPMFSRNKQYFDVVSDHILWTHPAFKLPESDVHKIHETAFSILPYGKDIRSS